MRIFVWIAVALVSGMPLAASAALAVKAPPATGLALYWSFDEGTGTTAFDYSTNANAGTLTSSPSWVFGPRGNAVAFASNGQYVSKAAPRGLDTGATARSMSAWIKINTAGTVMVPFVYGSCSPSSAAFGVYVNASNVLNFWGCGSDFSTGYVLKTGVWYHIAITTANGSTVTVYVNGVAVDTDSPSGGALVSPSGTAYVEIGGANLIDAGNYYFRGAVDEVRYYNRTLSAGEVVALYQSGGAVVYGAPTLSSKLNLNFETGTVGSCPVGWTCSGDAELASGSDSGGCAVGASGEGTNWLKLGCDNTIGTATSSPFILPFNINHISFLRAGGADGAASGLWVKRASDSTVLCTAASGTDTDTFFTDTCTGLGPYAGQRVVIVAADAHTGSWAKTYIDNIQFKDARGNTIAPPAAAGNTSAALAQKGSSLQNSLVGHWTFNGADFTTTVADKSESGNHGYVYGAATSSIKTIGKLGQGVVLDGVDDAIRVPNSASLNPGISDFTLVLWVKGRAMANSDALVLKTNGGGASSAYGWHFGVFDSLYPTVHFATGAAGHTKIQGAQSLQNGRWYHVAVSIDRDDMTQTKVYIDGAAVTTNVTNGDINTGSISNDVPLAIGSESDGEFYWDGQLDDARLYMRALSAAEVAQLYRLGR